jgi:ribosomal protein L31E
MEERLVTINFKKLSNSPRTKLIKRKIKFVKEFLFKKFKAVPKISNLANRAIMLSGRKRVKLKAVKEKEEVKVFALNEKTEEKKEEKREEKKEKKETKKEEKKKEESNEKVNEKKTNEKKESK